MIKIHKEGYSILTKTLIVFVVLNAALFYFFPGSIGAWFMLFATVVVYGLMLYFFRIPKAIEKSDFVNGVNAPTDGKVVVVERIPPSKFFDDERIQISIFMTIFNAHSNWMPVSGKVVHFSHVPGNFHAAYLPKSSTENEHTNIMIETPKGFRILTKQIAGAVARRIVAYVKEGETYAIGDPLGFIKFGSRMDVILPADSEILVKVGDVVQANVTVLAHLPHKD